MYNWAQSVIQEQAASEWKFWPGRRMANQKQPKNDKNRWAIHRDRMVLIRRGFGGGSEMKPYRQCRQVGKLKENRVLA